MAGKRGKKRSLAESTGSGRPRGRPSKKRATNSHPHGKDVDYEKDYKVRSIIDENDTQYHIDWEPDEETGEVYPPTWEPKENANSLAVDDWESRKAATAAGKQAATSGSGSAAPVKRRGRKKKIVVESSPPPESGQDDNITTTVADQRVQEQLEPFEPETQITAGATEIEESQQTANDEPVQEGTTQNGLFVAPSSPPSSYLAGVYQRVPSRPASRDENLRPPTSSAAESGIPQSAARDRDQPAAVSTQKSTNSASLVIPDSQSQGTFLEESTFRGFSPTQHTQRTQVEAVVDEPLQPSLPAAQDEQQQNTNSSSGAVVGATTPTASSRASEDQNNDLNREAELPARITSNEVSQAAQEPKATAPLPSQVASVGYGAANELAPATDLTTAKEPLNSGLGPDTAATSSFSNGVSLTDSSHSQVHTNGERQVVVLSSAEDHSSHSTSLNFESSIHEADFEPPPAAQRPLPSSALEQILTIPDPRPSQVSTVDPSTQQPSTSQVETPIGLTQSRQQSTRTIHYYGSSQSFPFQTQVPQQTTPQKTESPVDYTYTPGSRTLDTVDPDRRTPSAVSSRSPESTPFPSLPRKPVGAIGESAPSRFSLSSRERCTMESSPMPKRETLAEKVRKGREARAAMRASGTPVPMPVISGSVVNSSLENAQPASALPPSLIAEVAVAQAARLGSPSRSAYERSPSTVPAVEEVAPITREEMTTSERYETLLPQAQAQAQNSSKVEPQQHRASTSDANKPQDRPHDVAEDPETSCSHVVPLNPSAFQRDQYRANIYYEEKLITQVLNTEVALDDRIQAKANKFLERLRKVALHPDLVNPETLSQTTEPEIQAKWDIKTSAKFEFLNEFIANVSDRNLHVAVVAHGDRIPDMLENFFRGIKVPCKRWAHPLSIDPDMSPANLGVKVSIVDLDGGPQNVAAADVVIAMDPSVDYRHPLVRAVRKQTGQQVKWALLLTLVLPHTLEHVERSLQADLPTVTRTRVLIKATNECRFDAGRLESTQAPLKDAASAIADYLDDTSAEWPIAGLSQLEELDSQTETDIQAETHGVKRPHSDAGVEGSDEVKRARLSPSAGLQLSATVNPSELDITHVSDSLNKGTQSNTDLGDASLASPNTEQRLRELLQSVQDRLDEHVKALEDVQYRHEEQRKQLVEVTKERDTALLAAAKAQARMTGAEANNTALRNERTQLKEALAAANARLLIHEVPEIRELEEVRASAQVAKLEEEKAKKKAAAAEKDLEWTRSMYQDSSNSALKLAQANSELEAQLAHASHIAQGEQARARDLSIQGHNKALEQDNHKLRTTVENMKLAMKNKDEQIASLREGRGRMGTRGSSVPRSPRMGSPMKGRLSRQASPAASDVRGRGAHLHPLRNSAGT